MTTSAAPSRVRRRAGALGGCALRGLALGAVLIGLTSAGLQAGLWHRTNAAEPPDTPAAIAAATQAPTAPPAAPTVTPTAPAADTAQPQPQLPPTLTLTPSVTPSGQPWIVPTLWDTPTPWPTEVLTGTPTPVTPVPTPVISFTLPEQTVNILLLGSDKRNGDGGWRTDTMIVVSIDAASGTVSLLSIPRDLFVYVPGHGMARINTADSRGGPELIRQVLLYNLGIPIHFYARVNFDNFERIVDALGGVDVPVDCALHDWRLKSPELDPAVVENWQVYTQTVGVQHMDGDLALWYVRSRTSTNDFDRGRRQQKVLRAMYRTARDQELFTRIPELWNAFHDAVETNLGIGDLLWLSGVALRDDLRIRNSYLAGAVLSWVAPDGAQLLLPDWPRMEPIIRGVLSPPAANRGEQDRYYVEVWNGTTVPGIDRLAADRLATEGFYPSIGAADRLDYDRTRIIDFTGATKGSKVPVLREIFGVAPGDVITQVDPQSPVQYRVVLGAGYDSCRGARTSSSYITPTPSVTPTPTPTATPTPAP